MKNKPPPERPSGTGWAGKAAKHAAGSMTRRGALCRLGYAAAGILGARFLLADGPKALATVVANSPCQLKQDGCAVTSIYCGMETPAGASPAIDCGSLKIFGPDCDQNGCPAGTTPSGEWIACCTCPQNQAKGLSVTYQDCCGTVDASRCKSFGGINPSCASQICDPASCDFGEVDWCSPSFFGGYVCTKVTVGGSCTPKA